MFGFWRSKSDAMTTGQKMLYDLLLALCAGNYAQVKTLAETFIKRNKSHERNARYWVRYLLAVADYKLNNRSQALNKFNEFIFHYADTYAPFPRGQELYRNAYAYIQKIKSQQVDVSDVPQFVLESEEKWNKNFSSTLIAALDTLKLDQYYPGLKDEEVQAVDVQKVINAILEERTRITLQHQWAGIHAGVIPVSSPR